jgi:hypothetical protein
MMPAMKKAMESKAMEPVLKLWDEEVYNSVTVTGISIQGSIEDGSCVITGNRSILHTGGALNSPKISFNGDSFGFESTLQNRVQVIINEVFAYVFENKSSTPELFGELEEEDAA